MRSFVQRILSLLAICPRVRKDSGRIIAVTAWRIRILFLGLVLRKVVIDPELSALNIYSRYLWFIPLRRQFPFYTIEGITYGYVDESLDSSVSLAHKTFDRFTVGLRLNDDTKVRLFTFIGCGTFVNNGHFPDWCYWDDFALDFSGSQERESRVFVHLISKIIDAPVIPPRDLN